MEFSSFKKSNITLECALEICRRVIAAAQNKGISIAVSVVDTSGREVAFLRMDHAANVADEAARKKAKFAMGFSMPTGDTWYQFIKDDPILMNGVSQLPDFILLGGGCPLKENETIVGAIGVSGGHYKMDEAIISDALSQ
jgi:uncharacterized protein GlcG (DUF336 family)